MALTPNRAYAADQCTQLGRLVRIVEVTEQIIKGKDNVPLYQFDSLRAMSQSARTDKFRLLLIDLNLGTEIDRVARYLENVDEFLQIRAVNGSAFGRSKLNARAFRSLHKYMMKFTRHICDRGIGGSVKKYAADLQDSLGYKGSDGLGTKSLNQFVNNGKFENTQYTLRQQTNRLMAVFFLLSLVFGSMYVAKKILNYVHAIRLSRYECKIIATVEIGETQISGIINVIGNQGLSFQALPNAPQHHKDLLVEDVEVRFLTEKYNFKGVLTKNFTDGSGFRLLVILQSVHLKGLLELSEITPVRKTNFKNKKKRNEPKKAKMIVKAKNEPVL